MSSLIRYLIAQWPLQSPFCHMSFEELANTITLSMAIGKKIPILHQTENHFYGNISPEQL